MNVAMCFCVLKILNGAFSCNLAGLNEQRKDIPGKQLYKMRCVITQQPMYDISIVRDSSVESGSPALYQS